MKFVLDTTGLTFRVVSAPEAKTDNKGVQRSEQKTGRPLWVTSLFMEDDNDGEKILVTTSGEKPEIVKGQLVVPKVLELKPWAMTQTDNRTGKEQFKHGNAFMAEGFQAFNPETAKPAKV
jgi:hypothetical protein